MPLYGQEDDDFAYQDEHIEMESENQEYGDLDEREFDARAALRLEAKPPTAAIGTVPRLGPKPAIAAGVSSVKQQTLFQAPPNQATSSKAAELVRERPRDTTRSPAPQSSAAKQGTKKAAKPSPKSLAEAESNEPPSRKRPPQLDSRQGKQKAQKKTVKSRAQASANKIVRAKKALAPKKTAMAKKSAALRRRAGVKALTRTKGTRATQTKRRA